MKILLSLGKAYFRCRAQARYAEITSARLDSAWHASVLDEENSHVETTLLMISNQR